MPAPPPPPPPPPPGSPPAPPPQSSKSSSQPPKLNKGAETDRNVLLSSIRQGATLKKTVTVDKSAPLISGKTAVNSNATSDSNTSSATNGGTSGGGPMGLGGLFAGGMPKLRPTGQRSGSNTGSQSKFVNNVSGSQPKVSNAVPSSAAVAPSLKMHPPSPPTHKVPSSNNKGTVRRRNFPSDIQSNTLNRSAPPPPPPSNRKPSFSIGVSNTTDSIPTNTSSNNKSGPPLPSKPPGVSRAASAAGAIGRGRPAARPAPGVKPPPPPKLPSTNGPSHNSHRPSRPGSYAETNNPTQNERSTPLRNMTVPDGSHTLSNAAPLPPQSRTIKSHLHHGSRPVNPTMRASGAVRPSPTPNQMRYGGYAPPPPPPSQSKPNFLHSNPTRPPSVRPPPPPPTRAAGSAPPTTAPPPPPHRGPGNLFPPPHRGPANSFPPPPSQTLNRNSMDQQSSTTAPPPPPARNSSVTNKNTKRDFESRFFGQFHGIEMLPPPLPSFRPSPKSYQSESDKNKQRQRLPPPPPPDVSLQHKVPAV